MIVHHTGATVLVAGLVVLTAATGGAVLGVAVAQSGPTIGFSGVEDVTVGATDSAQIRFAAVNDSDGVGSFTVNVTYDADAVSVNASGTGAFEVRTATPASGVLRVTGFTGQYPGPNGSGALFNLSVTGESAADTVVLGLTIETFTDANGHAIAVSAGNATLAVESDDDDSDGGGDGDDGGGGGGGGQPGQAPSGEVEIADRRLLNDTVTTGEPVVARVELSNFDPARGRITLMMAADGATVAEQTVAVGASTRRTVYLRTRFGSSGTYPLSVNGESIGSVTVEASATPTSTSTVTAMPGTPTPEETPPSTTSPGETPEPTSVPTDSLSPTTGGDGAGFGVLIAVLAVVVVLLNARRWA